MKKLAFILALLMALSLCACGQEAQTQEEETAETHAGTRSDPYELGDDITIVAKDRFEDYTVEYQMSFSEVWGSSQVAKEYPNYSIEDRILVRGTICVACDATEDSISFQLNPVFITDSMNEERAQIETYKSGELNNSLSNVYSGGSYDVIVLGSDDGISDLTVPYLKITYLDADGNDASLWISLAQSEEDTTSADTQESTEAVPIAETEEDSDSEEDTADSTETTAAAAVQTSMTSEELEAALLNEPMYVESTKYSVQDERYKSLYPDLLQAIFKNNTGTDVKNVVVAFVAWDKNGFPVKIKGKYDYNDGYYVQQCTYSDVNMVNGDTYGKDVGLALNSNTDNISTFKAIVVSYEDFDGNTWENPYYDTWDTLYDNQKLAQ